MQTQKQAIESAYAEALKFLEKKNMVVDDATQFLHRPNHSFW
jgi:hypothetical protein